VFDAVMGVNVKGVFLGLRHVLPVMIGQGRGAVVNTASIAGLVGTVGMPAYVASKHAVIGLTKTWAKELGAKNIAVNAVCPGWVRTEASLRSLAAMAARSGRDEEELLEKIVGAQALPGLMEPADIVGAYLFLASDLSANITGQTIGVDRGEVPW
jgi:3-hydroxybutyrate dehydrogenase